jgi:hypothetical protein
MLCGGDYFSSTLQRKWLLLQMPQELQPSLHPRGVRATASLADLHS